MRYLFVLLAIFMSVTSAFSQQVDRQESLEDFKTELETFQSQLSKRLNASSPSVLISEDLLPVFAQPSLQSDQIETIEPGSAFLTGSESNGWTAIFSADGSASGWAKTSVLEAAMANSSGQNEGLIDWMIDQAVNMKARWSDNPFVSVTGFTISLGLSPTLDIAFEIK